MEFENNWRVKYPVQIRIRIKCLILPFVLGGRQDRCILHSSGLESFETFRSPQGYSLIILTTNYLLKSCNSYTKHRAAAHLLQKIRFWATVQYVLHFTLDLSHHLPQLLVQRTFPDLPRCASTVLSLWVPSRAFFLWDVSTSFRESTVWPIHPHIVFFNFLFIILGYHILELTRGTYWQTSAELVLFLMFPSDFLIRRAR